MCFIVTVHFVGTLQIKLLYDKYTDRSSSLFRLAVPSTDGSSGATNCVRQFICHTPFIVGCLWSPRRKLSNKRQFRANRFRIRHDLRSNLHDVLQMCIAFLHLFGRKIAQQHLQPREFSFSEFRRSEVRVLLVYIKNCSQHLWNI